jgi:hypothetical protein
MLRLALLVQSGATGWERFAVFSVVAFAVFASVLRNARFLTTCLRLPSLVQRERLESSTRRRVSSWQSVARVIDAGSRWRCEIPARQRSISTITRGAICTQDLVEDEAWP